MQRIDQPERSADAPPRGPHWRRALVIGLDGATFDLLAPLMHAGLMPSLSALCQTAALAELRSTEPPITPTAWTTFLTGCQPWDHVIFDYRYLDHRRGRLLLNHAGRVAQPTLLDCVNECGGAVVSLNLPMTWPRRPRGTGIVVGGIDSPSADAALAAEPIFRNALRARGIDYPLDLVWRRRPRDLAELQFGVRRTEQVFQSRVQAAEVADSLCDWQLMIVQFQTLDALQHRLWDLLIGEPSPGCPGSWVTTAREAMTALDRCVGGLCELAARRDAGVVVVSDHGFGPFRGIIQLPNLLARGGRLRWATTPQRLAYRAQRIAWKARKSWRRHIARSRRSGTLPRPPGALLPIDWDRSTALTLHSNMGALVYLNTPERFGRGPVVGSRLRDEVTEQTVDVFEAASHPKTGERLFPHVYRTAEWIKGDTCQSHAPDLIAIPAAGLHTRSKPSASDALIVDDPELAGTHRKNGVLIVAPGKQGVRLQADLRDVAPTLLSLLGIPAPKSMTGRCLSELIPAESAAAALATSPHFSGEISAVRANTARDEIGRVASAETDTVAVGDRLRALGYLD